MIFTIATSKGGTAKTTTAAVLAQAAILNGQRALAIDLDPQGTLTRCLAADATQANSYDLLNGAPAADVIQTSPQGMDVIPASPNLMAETREPGSARRLREALQPIKRRYDFIIIDTPPPAAGELLLNALTAADRAIIPVFADGNGTTALSQIYNIIRPTQKNNPKLKIAGVIITDYDNRETNLGRAMRQQIIDLAAEKGIPYLGCISHAVAVSEAATLKQSLYDYAPKEKPAAEYFLIYRELMK